MIPNHLNPRPQKGDIWEAYAGHPLLIVDIVFDKQYNSHVALMKHLTGQQMVIEVPTVSIRQGVGVWVKIA